MNTKLSNLKLTSVLAAAIVTNTVGMKKTARKLGTKFEIMMYTPSK